LFIALEAVMKKEEIVISYEWNKWITKHKPTAPTSQLLIGWDRWIHSQFSTIVSYLIILQCQIMSATNTFIDPWTDVNVTTFSNYLTE
jgi:hypothetical protein